MCSVYYYHLDFYLRQAGFIFQQTVTGKSPYSHELIRKYLADVNAFKDGKQLYIRENIRSYKQCSEAFTKAIKAMTSSMQSRPYVTDQNIYMPTQEFL